MHTAPPRNRVALTILSVLGLLLMGGVGGAFGPSLPTLAASWAVPLDQAGAMFTLLFLGNCTGTAITGFILDRLGRRLLLVTGIGLIGFGVALIALSPALLLGLVGAFIAGFGGGILSVALNLFIGDLYPTRRSQALNLTSSAFGVGSLLSPVAIGLVLRSANTPVPVLVALAVFGALVSVAFALVAFPPATAFPAATDSGPPIYRDSFILLLALMLFLYVGAETSFGGWAFSFASRGAGLDETLSGIAATVFWLSITVSRLAAGILGRWVPHGWLPFGGAILGGLAAGLVALFSSSGVAVFAGAALIGFGFGPVFPTAVGLAADRYPHRAGVAVGLTALVGALGGAILPYLAGFLMVGAGVQAAALSIMCAALLVAAIQFIILTNFTARNARVTPAPPAMNP